MESKQLILTHDLGTSCDKACLFTSNGDLVCEATQDYTIYYGGNGQAEQDPNDWWAAFVKTTREVLAKADVCADAITAISFSAQMNSLIAVDRQGNLVLDRAMTWMDRRGKAQADFVKEHYGISRFNRVCGSSVDMSIMFFTKLMWIRENMPEKYEKIYRVLGTKEYMVMRLTGIFGMVDYSQVACSGIYDVERQQYIEELVTLTGIAPELLGTIVPSTTIIGTVARQISKETGLSPKTQVVLGVGDGTAGFIGAGGMKKDTMIACFGTASWLSRLAPKIPESRDQFQLGYSYMDNGQYTLSLHSHATGAVTDWALKTLLKLDKASGYAVAEAMAEKSQPGASGVYLNPSFIGGNGSHPSLKMEGALLGLKLSTLPNDIARAIYEAPVLDLYECYKYFFVKEYLIPKEIYMIGGGGKSLLQRKILANVFDVPVCTHKPQIIQNAAAVGAFMTACIGIGLYKDYEEMSKLYSVEQTIEPDPRNVQDYVFHKENYCARSQFLANIYTQEKEEI